jgi:hypothetical protein
VTVVDIVSEVEAAGIALRIDGEKVRVWYPNEDRRAELSGQIAMLRNHRAEVAAYLRARSTVPPMPDGIRLVRWEPKPAPIAVTRVEIVTDVHKFVVMTLLELEAALADKRWLASNHSVRELIERLEECGVVVERLDR